jgi:hypothetical protein
MIASHRLKRSGVLSGVDCLPPEISSGSYEGTTAFRYATMTWNGNVMADSSFEVIFAEMLASATIWSNANI